MQQTREHVKHHIVPHSAHNKFPPDSLPLPLPNNTDMASAR